MQAEIQNLNGQSERDSLDTVVAQWSHRAAHPNWRPEPPEAVIRELPDALPMRAEDLPNDGLGVYRDMLKFPETELSPARAREIARLLAETEQPVRVVAPAEPAARKPRTIFVPPVPRGFGKKKRWASA